MSLIHLMQNKCPKCHQGQVFSTTNLFSFRPAKMQEECSHCRQNFSKEPGFYWGAMYVSYGLATLEMALTYVFLISIGIDAFDFLNLGVCIALVLVLFPFNFRMARLIWLYLFTNLIES
ncbi:zinc finger-like domain-containing protein [Runella salmonicolor]|uniref:Zinc finger-like domain-containing protein n=1 Tax=Runella salmonicolor TaxID=2950278 RepID=A0ABT1FJZ9_9BACT|nr:zinc finger-like domain-containing protein [Runella salmonicolor]MCP1382096.1 zinc finger-like domain-containing protein [Runella salmonicolor]